MYFACEGIYFLNTVSNISNIFLDLFWKKHYERNEAVGMYKIAYVKKGVGLQSGMRKIIIRS